MRMIASMTTNSQFPAAMKVPSWIIAAYIETMNTKTNGMSTGHTGRLMRSRIMARIDIVRAASNWFVVPKSGQITMPPRPSPPAENASPKPVTNVISVATKTLSLTPKSSKISAVTNRCSRTPVSMVVAANSTAIVARMVADRLSGMPRPALRIPPPALTNAPAPPSSNAEYTSSQAARVAKPEVVAMMVPSASSPSPTAPKYPTSLASGSLLSCLEDVPEETTPWNPEIAPQATVTKSSGMMPGVPSGTFWLMAGATTVGFEINTAR